ncbi:MAG: (2Fe-2S)-binding protein [Planctomycetaceae bacterium]|nr:(2Fe-2S)-binding protein [Planctomycetaceae bacterium]
MRDQNQRGGPGFNRRDFLKGSGAAVAATAIATSDQKTEAAKATKKNVFAAKAQDVTLNVNGKDYKLKIEPRVTLLEALRNDLNFTGCKDIDDDAAVGADTVIIDGKAALAGSRLAVECQGQKITTVESLHTEQKTDEVVEGFVQHDAMQCGFCTPGFVMATRAFLDKNPNANLEEIQKGLGGNLCRCGTYHGITQCALEIAKKGGA